MSRLYKEIDKAEEARKRYLYARLILDGKLKLPYKVAVRLCGPDRAYHLYRFSLNKR